jgi:hypothetical protein
MALRLDRLFSFNAQSFPTLWQRHCEAIEETFSAQQSQLDTITAMLDPNTLTPDKKPVWVFMQSYLTGEQSDLDAKATSYGITTEKAAYDTAVSALTSYLGGLTSPVAWNDTSGNTAIVDATFRGKFTDVLTTKQALLNAISAASKALADAAQSTASTAKKNDKISASATVPSVVVSASDAGTSATITVAAHTRQYGDGTTLAVAGGSITGLPYSTLHAIYYDDPTTANASPTYSVTTTLKNAQPNMADGRHYVDQITTPASGGGSTSGSGIKPPGGGGPYP